MNPFDALPPDSRIWVFAANRELSGDDEARIATLMEKVLGVWKSKVAMVKGLWEIRERRFLIVGADEGAERLGGCSIDAMMAWIMKLEAESGLKLIDRMSVYWRDAEGRVQRTGRAEFRRLLEGGTVGSDTRVFDTVISRVESLREGRFELPLSASWHAQLLAPRAEAMPN